MSDQHLYACVDPECPVVTFVDRVDAEAPPEAGVCPGDACVGPAVVLRKNF